MEPVRAQISILDILAIYLSLKEKIKDPSPTMIKTLDALEAALYGFSASLSTNESTKDMQ